MQQKTVRTLLLLTSLSLLSACTPVGLAASAGATVGVATAQEGGIRAATTDAAIRLQILDAWFKRDLKIFTKLSLAVKEGRVLITGSVPTADMRVEAVRLAWQAEGVRQVINEIAVDEGGGITGAAKDTWIASSIKARITFDKYVQAINYNVEVSNGTVYLMGVAQDQEELNRVIDYARNTNNVKNVVSYVRMRYENPKESGKPVGGEETPPPVIPQENPAPVATPAGGNAAKPAPVEAAPLSP